MTAAAGEAPSASTRTANPNRRMLRKPEWATELRSVHDLACVVHIHSTASDGTSTVPEIARAAARAQADVVLLTDHDTLAAKQRGEEGLVRRRAAAGRRGGSPLGRDHYLAFGVDEHVRHRGLDACGIARAVRDAGGFGFAAHPFSEGFARSKRPGMPFGGLDCDALHGIELWASPTTPASGSGASSADPLPRTPRGGARPPAGAQHAPLGRALPQRRVIAIGGLDAHQFGKRIGPVVPFRVMAYHRTFRYIRTHVLCTSRRRGELERDRELVFDALREGRCYIAVDSVAPRAASRWGRRRADGRRGARRAPDAAGAHPARRPLRLLRDGQELADAEGTSLDAEVEEPGVYRAEALRQAKGRERTWILSNPVYLR